MYIVIVLGLGLSAKQKIEPVRTEAFLKTSSKSVMPKFFKTKGDANKQINLDRLKI